MNPEELSNLRLIDLTLSNSENKFDELLIVSFDRLAIEFEKDQRRLQTNSFVAINEGMVLNKMEQVGSCHVEDVGMQELSAKGHFWLCDGGMQQIGAAQSFTAAIAVDLASMQLQNIFHRQKLRHDVLLSKFLKGFLVASIYLSAHFPQFFLPTGVFGSGNPDGGTIRGQLHRALRINLQKVENRPINDKCPAVAMLNEVLDHLRISNGVNKMVIHCSTISRSCQKESTIVQRLSDTPGGSPYPNSPLWNRPSITVC
ncbi:MAG: hypothetical protein R3C17_13005 [Planctomycetaceae bacterium]